jgi:hypothetical protein
MALNNIVSPLVDSLSLLVLECVGGSLKDVTTHCVALAGHTQALVDQAQKVAMATDDTEVVNEIINSINIIADQIGGLVEAFQALISNRTDPTLVKNFSTTAQNVADAISSLVNATDETSQKRLIGLVRYVSSLARSPGRFSLSWPIAIFLSFFFVGISVLPVSLPATFSIALHKCSFLPRIQLLFTAFSRHGSPLLIHTAKLSAKIPKMMKQVLADLLYILLTFSMFCLTPKKKKTCHPIKQGLGVLIG